jgi:hypothetical protein
VLHESQLKFDASVEAVGVRLTTSTNGGSNNNNNNNNSNAVHVYSVYKPPSADAATFYGDLCDIVTANATCNSTTIIAGDTNMDVFVSAKASKVAAYCDELEVAQWIRQPMHGGACIDHVMVTTGRLVENIRLMAPIEKLHTPIMFDVRVLLPPPPPPNCMRTTCSWRSANWVGMEVWLNEQPYDPPVRV